MGLKYINVFNPEQVPNGAYAAIISKLIKIILKVEYATINWEGKIWSRT